MSTTYKIVGVDGRQYGPVPAGQIHQWIAEHRANAQTQVLAEGAAEWKPLSALPEFAFHFATHIPPTIGPGSRPPGTSGFAVAGMVFGLLSLPFCCCYGFPFNVLGLVFSATALAQIRHHPEVYEGRGFAIAGLVISILSILFYGIVLVIALATGNGHFDWNFNTP